MLVIFLIFRTFTFTKNTVYVVLVELGLWLCGFSDTKFEMRFQNFEVSDVFGFMLATSRVS